MSGRSARAPAAFWRMSMNGISEKDNLIVFENARATVAIARGDASVEIFFDRKTGRDIRAKAGVPFFAPEAPGRLAVPVRGVSLEGGVRLRVETDAGAFFVKAEALPDYFTFELEGGLPEGIFAVTLAKTEFVCDASDKKNTGAIGIAMTAGIDPLYYPDSKAGKTGGRVVRHLASDGEKLALVIAPVCEQQAIIKEICLKIDKNRGIMSLKGGAWGRDARVNFTNYTIQMESSRAFVESEIPFFKKLGVEQIDFHKGPGTFRQGDFCFMRYKNAAEFRENVTTLLESHGMTAGLHTYAHYIDYDCAPVLSNPDCQRQLKVMERFTLAADVDENITFLRTEEPVDGVSDDFGFFAVNTPFLLVDNEIIQFEKREGGFAAKTRGAAGTVPAKHLKGAEIRHLEGLYFGFTPVFGSDLFYEIARNTAKTYNEGGFRSIYLDALDGIDRQCDPENEAWFYMAAFVREILKNCAEDPVLEMSTFKPSMWASRGRIGAWDTPYRAYKGFNLRHTESNVGFIDRYGAPILGWYDFYPMTDKYPGNEHTKYHHTDAIDHMGSLAVMYDFANVFNGTSEAMLERYAGLRRNVELYGKYDKLRREQYFPEEYRQKLISGKYEYALAEDGDGKYGFVEKNYGKRRLFDLCDASRNTAEFANPFKEQTPFVRIEALLSADTSGDGATSGLGSGSGSVELLPLDFDVPLTEQTLLRRFENETDISEKLAKTVRVRGNGVPGGKIAIKLRCATNSEKGFGEYVIDTDFEGEREFIFVESDNGERDDHGFEQNEGLYAIYRSSLNNDRLTEISVETEGDMTGVRMSSVMAYRHVYEVLKNPSVSVGNTSVTFECELMSSDFIEFDGKNATVTDRFGNKKEIWFESDLKVPAGGFKASLTAKPLNGRTAAAILTLGFTGERV